MQNIRKTLLIIIPVLMLQFTSLCYAEDHPTKEEWLEVYIATKVRENTDAWEQRTALRVIVDAISKQIVITLTSANGEPSYSDAKRQLHRGMVEGMVMSLINKYEWAKDYQVKVQFI